MPEEVVNKPLSPREAVQTVGRQATRLMEDGACRVCAIRMVAKRYGITKERTLICLLDYEAAL